MDHVHVDVIELQLRQAGIERLADGRRVPIGRARPSWSRRGFSRLTPLEAMAAPYRVLVFVHQRRCRCAGNPDPAHSRRRAGNRRPASGRCRKPKSNFRMSLRISPSVGRGQAVRSDRFGGGVQRGSHGGEPGSSQRCRRPRATPPAGKLTQGSIRARPPVQTRRPFPIPPFLLPRVLDAPTGELDRDGLTEILAATIEEAVKLRSSCGLPAGVDRRARSHQRGLRLRQFADEVIAGGRQAPALAIARQGPSGTRLRQQIRHHPQQLHAGRFVDCGGPSGRRQSATT